MDWQKYESFKRSLPPMTPEEYEAKMKERVKNEEGMD